jgi:hypothetical protein
MATLAVVLFALAQPRMFCAVHCLILDHLDGDAATTSATSVSGRRLVADEASHAPDVDTVCGITGTVLTSAPAIPVGSVGPATLAVVDLPVFGEEPPAPPPASEFRVPTLVTFPVATPPPQV